MVKRIRAHVNPLSILKEYTFLGFPNTNPIFIDVGACKGEFIEALAHKFPNKNGIAFEIRVPLAESLKQKFAGVSNLVVFDGDAGRNFKTALEPSLKKGVEIETIYVNFPDPWFKDRHKKRRFITTSFLDSMKDFLPKKTVFVFQTDQKFLFDETVEVVKNSAYSSIEFFTSPPFGVQTDWEMAKQREGSPIYRMRFSQDSF